MHQDWQIFFSEIKQMWKIIAHLQCWVAGSETQLQVGGNLNYLIECFMA